ncbi:MAG: SCO family protein [Chloroflexi bacterium]|nr:SCO family protein [Chloroflexota bacterium]
MLRPQRLRLFWVLSGLLALLLAVGCGEAAPKPSGGEVAQPYEGTKLEGLAPGFRLTDHRGESVALSDFRGKAVALAFLDPRCTDVCPLTALHFRVAGEALGRDADRVAFLAIDVNPEADQPADVVAATEKWGLAQMPNWHFLRGGAQEVEAVLSTYYIATAPKPDKAGEVVHTPGVYVIDQKGQRRWYISTPMEGGLPASWAPPLSDILVKRLREVLGGGS